MDGINNRACTLLTDAYIFLLIVVKVWLESLLVKFFS